MLSYLHGASDAPLLGETIGHALDMAAARWGSREALKAIEQDVSLTWLELKQRSEAFAAGLLCRGLKPGDRIGIWSLNRIEWTITQFAAAKAGLILVSINPAYRAFELEFALNKAGCTALVISPAFKGSNYPELLAKIVPELRSHQSAVLLCRKLPNLQLVVQIEQSTLAGAISFEAIESEGRLAGTRALRDIEKAVQFDFPVNIQFTSGTTGSPKGVTLSHFNILNNGYFVGRALGLSPSDRMCIPVPLYHCFGMVMGNLACLSHGTTMIYPGQGFDPFVTLRTVDRERCTVLYGVPTMFIAQLDHPRFDEFNLRSLRTGIMAGSPCPIEVMRRVNERMHLPEMTIAYGMTETSPVSFQSLRSDSLDRRVSTVGRVHPHVESKIVDESGRIEPRGVRGEICTRGYSVMLGYWNDAEQTSSVKDSAGWMHTGDLGIFDEEGYCKIVGRIKDLVIRGGENLYPREIEEFLHTHPAICDVQVFGVSDFKFGEELCAWVKLHQSDLINGEQLREFCRGQISAQKIPRYIHFVDSFPMTVTGKIQKFIMKQQMEEMLGLSQPPPA